MMQKGQFVGLAGLVVLIMTRSVLPLAAAEMQTQSAKVFEKGVTRAVRMNYLLHLPAEYKSKSAKKWPLLVFLHGSGEKGSDVSKVKIHGPPKIVEGKPDFPFILLSPQCPLGQSGWIDDDVLALIQGISASHKVDRKRIYLTGLSMGGYGTWSLATSHPEVFAAVAPICGGGDPNDVAWMARTKAKAIEKLGVWAFHGDKDTVVPLSESRDAVDAFRRAGCKDIQLTVYPDTGHNAWEEAYSDPRLYEWFLRHRRE